MEDPYIDKVSFKIKDSFPLVLLPFSIASLRPKYLGLDIYNIDNDNRILLPNRSINRFELLL